MKRYVPQQQQDKPDVSIAKARLRVAAIQAGPSALVRRHPWSAVIGTTVGTFALTAIAKLFFGGSSDNDDSSADEKKKSGSSGGSIASTVLRSALSMGLPVIQAQLSKHFFKQQQQEQSQEQHSGAPGVQEKAHAVG